MLKSSQVLSLTALVTVSSGCVHLREAVQDSIQYQKSIQVVAALSRIEGTYEIFTDNTNTCRIDFIPRLSLNNNIYFDRETLSPFSDPFDLFYKQNLLRIYCPPGFVQ